MIKFFSLFSLWTGQILTGPVQWMGRWPHNTPHRRWRWARERWESAWRPSAWWLPLHDTHTHTHTHTSVKQCLTGQMAVRLMNSGSSHRFCPAPSGGSSLLFCPESPESEHTWGRTDTWTPLRNTRHITHDIQKCVGLFDADCISSSVTAHFRW